MATQMRVIEEINRSGVMPLDLRVVVLPDAAEARVGNIILPESKVDRDQHAQCKATLIAVGENAWEEAKARSPYFTMPLPGDRVMIAKYGGIVFKGMDGKDYRIMNDEDVTARLQEG